MPQRPPDPKTWEDVNDLNALRGCQLSRGLELYTAERGTLSLRNWYRGKSVFLVCGGPSLAKLDLSQLRRPGIVTFGVNNVWTVFRPTLWCCIDRPGNFIPTGWKDPAIIKFVPIGLLNEKLHEKVGGKFQYSQYAPQDMPSVFYFRRNEKFNPQTFLTEPSVNWGNHKKVKDQFGQTGARSVMLAALRLIHYLGFKRINIIGADFGMAHSEPGAPAQNYAWKQWRHDSSVNGNNRTYNSLNDRLGVLYPYFKAQGVTIHNCTPGGGLRAFPRMGFQEAVEREARECESPVDTEGWYNHSLGKKRPGGGDTGET
jgi:hypothetical protein